MADQKRWWKLWCTAPSDELLQRIPPAHRWAWAVLGAYTKAHGDNGRVTVSETNMVLAAEMGVACSDMICVIKSFPHVVIEECKNRHGEFTVTWQNWVKYQEDSTQAERARASRSKRRGEEKRGEETRREEKKPQTLTPVVDKSTPWPTALDDVRTFLISIQAPDSFFNQTYWLRIDQWLGGNDSAVFYFDELKAYLAWCASQNGVHRHKDQLKGFRNWLSTCARWKERDAQRKAVIGRGSQYTQRV
jgi:hypothetical protein